MRILSTVAAAFLLMSPSGAADAQETAAAPSDPSSIALQIVIPGIEDAAALGDGGAEGEGEGAAFGWAVVNQRLTGNRVEESGVSHSSRIENSFLGNQGLVSVNQDSGNLNNQANVRAIAFANGDAEVVLPGVELSARSSDNEVISSGLPHSDAIVGSFNDTVGIVGVNQSSGNLNQQANVLALAVGLRISPEVAILEEHDLDAAMPEPCEAVEPTEPRTETLMDSFTNFRGIAQVSQSAGNQNIISNVIGISVDQMGPQ
jgi:hypothetical protein